MRSFLRIFFHTALLLVGLSDSVIAGNPCPDSWSDQSNFKTERQNHFDLSIDRYLKSPTFRHLHRISELISARLASNHFDELQLCVNKIQGVIDDMVPSDPRFHSLTLGKILFENAMRAHPKPPANPAVLAWVDRYVKSKVSRAILSRLRDAGTALELKVLGSDLGLSPEKLNSVYKTLREMGLIRLDPGHVSLTELGLQALTNIEAPHGSADDGYNQQ